MIGEAQLRAALEAIPTRVALLDRDRRYIYVNRHYIEFAGKPEAEILGHTEQEVLAEEGFATLYPQGERALTTGEVIPWEGWLEYRQGRRYLQRYCAPLLGDDGAIAGYFVFNRDLTALKLSEQALAEQLAARTASEALNAAIIAAALDCIIAIDEAGNIVEFNAAAEATFGYRRAEALGRPIAELVVPPSLRQRHVEGFRRYLKGGEARILGRRIEIDGMRANGEVFPIELTITEVPLPDRRIFTAHLRDLTARRADEAEIRRQREALQQSEKMAAVGSLLAGVAHELNNPLSIVIGNAQILTEAAATVSPELDARAQRVQAAAERCGRIVRSFLAMARRRERQQRPTSLRELIDGPLEMLAYGLRAAGIEIALDIPDGLPPLLCDPDQMQQVVINLLTNARQALEGHPAPRRVRITARGEAGSTLLEIADNGPGVPEAIRVRVFDPFFTTKPLGAGSGIGLGLSRGIVEAHGGTLTLAPPDGSGARFLIRLPLAQTSAPGSAGAAAAAAPADTRDERSVLIIDDEAEVARLLSELLAGLGFRSEMVHDGAAAQARLRQRDYDAILCDVRMPEVDGPALFAWLGETKPHLRQRIAFVTADSLGAASADFLAQAHRPILEKPFLPAELRRLMGALCSPGKS
jgi:two-component system NtrC family sensor kinase